MLLEEEIVSLYACIKIVVFLPLFVVQ